MHEELLQEHPVPPIPKRIKESLLIVSFLIIYGVIEGIFGGMSTFFAMIIVGIMVNIAVIIGESNAEKEQERKDSMHHITGTFVQWIQSQYKVSRVYAPISLEIFDPWVHGILNNNAETAKTHVITENGERYDYIIGLENGKFVLKDDPEMSNMLPAELLRR